MSNRIRSFLSIVGWIVLVLVFLSALPIDSVFNPNEAMAKGGSILSSNHGCGSMSWVMPCDCSCPGMCK